MSTPRDIDPKDIRVGDDVRVHHNIGTIQLTSTGTVTMPELPGYYDMGGVGYRVRIETIWRAELLGRPERTEVEKFRQKLLKELNRMKRRDGYSGGFTAGLATAAELVAKL